MIIELKYVKRWKDGEKQIVNHSSRPDHDLYRGKYGNEENHDPEIKSSQVKAASQSLRTERSDDPQSPDERAAGRPVK
jgi:hypothetical protein